jgi:predicted Co/Zn/Cd cation transporter (cation efflux family)
MTNYQPYPAPVQVDNGKGLSTAGMILGIVAWSVVVLTFGFGSLLSLVLSIIGLPMSAVGFQKANRTNREGRGMAIAGITLNASGLLVALIVFAWIITAAASVNAANNGW